MNQLIPPIQSTLEIWDPHFHIWDISRNTKSGHDASQLFEPNHEPIYSWREYEHDMIQAGPSFSHTGGVFVEVASVCHTQLSGALFSETCLAETSWVSSELEELVEVCSRILVMRAGRLVAEVDPQGLELSDLLTLCMEQ